MPSGIYERVKPAYNKGKTGLYKHTEEWKLAMSRRVTGNKYRAGKPSSNKGTHPEALQGENHPMYGKKHTDEAKLKMSLSHKGNHPKNEFKAGNIPWHKGSKGLLVNCNKGKHTGIIPKTAFKKGVYAGENHWNWKGGITSINQKIRQSIEYEEWRTKVFERDLYSCQYCGEVGGRLEADHIKPFCEYPELRLDVSNGRTLCKCCHLKIGWNRFREDNPNKKLYTSSVLTGVSEAVEL